MDNELRAVTGTTATISYECAFADNTKKTVTVGSYRNADLPTTSALKTSITTFNAADTHADFNATFVSPSGGAQFSKIEGCTVTVTNTNVIY